MQAAQAEQKGGMYYGWIMLPFILIFSYLQYSLWLVSVGSYVAPMTKELGWTRTFMMGAFSLGAAVGNYGGPVLGAMIDRFGARLLMIIGGASMGLGAWVTSFSDASDLFWYAGWILMMYPGYTWTGYPGTGKVISNWWLQRRGFAMGLLTLSGAFVYMMSAVHAAMVDGLGWRMALRVWGVVIWVALIGIALLVIRNRPEEKGYKQDGIRMTAEELAAWRSRGRTQSPGPGAQAAGGGRVTEAQFGILDALKSPALWLLCIAGLAAGMALQIMTTQQLPMLEARGIARVLAASVLGFQGLAGAPARFLSGWLFDVFGKNSIRVFYAIGLALMVVGLVILIYAPDMTWLWVFAIIFGFGQGLTVTAPVTMLPMYFGAAIYSTVYGVRMFVLGFGSVGGPIFAAWVYDTTGKYDIALWVSAAVIAISAVLILLAAPPKQPAGASR